MLRELVSLMEDKSIKEGSIIRVISSKNAIRITDLENKTVDERKLALPNAEAALLQAISEYSAAAKSKADEKASNFLSFL